MAVTLVCQDLSPRFLKFYELAQGADPDRRWELWKEHYGMAAVPPTEAGMQLARRMLDESFDRYPEVLESIRAGVAGFRPDPQTALEQVCQVLGLEGDIEVDFIAYVGNLEANAFAFTLNGRPRVHFPLDFVDLEFRRVLLPHEFAHVVHERLCGSTGGYVRSVAMLAMMEGIAVRTSQAVVPGLPDERYIELGKEGWLAECRRRDWELLTGIRSWLPVVSEEAMQRFTFGEGSTGLDREAYYVGWRVVSHLQEQGQSLAHLARVPENEVVALFEESIAAMTA